MDRVGWFVLLRCGFRCGFLRAPSGGFAAAAAGCGDPSAARSGMGWCAAGGGVSFSGFRRGSFRSGVGREKGGGFFLRLFGSGLSVPGSVVDVSVLNHAVGPVVRDDDVVEDEDADPAQKLLKLYGAGDVLRRGGAGSARVVVAE